MAETANAAANSTKTTVASRNLATVSAVLMEQTPLGVVG